MPQDNKERLAELRLKKDVIQHKIRMNTDILKQLTEKETATRDIIWKANDELDGFADELQELEKEDANDRVDRTVSAYEDAQIISETKNNESNLSAPALGDTGSDGPEKV
jgi:hypothetical protein